jgi:integrase
LPKPSKVRKVEHFAALPYAKLPELMQKLRQQEGPAARALEFTILTAARLSEARNATVQEIDHGNKVWTVPGGRMKGGKEHRVPLSARALELAARGDQHLFPSPYFPDKAISEARLRELLRRLGYDGITIHGTARASFKTWAMERTRFDNHTIEASLAHSSSKLEQSYMRGDLFIKRRKLLESWAEFCASKPEQKSKTVVPLRSA